MDLSLKQNRRAFVARRFLQVTVALGALVPVLAGLMGVLLGPAMVNDSGISGLSLDSHYRYLSGLLMGIGLGFWTTIPDIERKTVRFQLLAAIVILGGLGRLYSLIRVGIPDSPMQFGLIMELIIMPILILFQRDVARRFTL